MQNTTAVHVYKVPPIKGRSETHSDSTFIDLGSPMVKYEHDLSPSHRSHADMLYVPQKFGSTIPVVMFDISGTHARRRVGYVIHFPLQVGSSNDGGSGNSKPIEAARTVCIPCVEDTSELHIEIGIIGHRLIWVEHDLESSWERVMKFEESVSGSTVLIPSRPDLPFEIGVYSGIAIDEATGRLGLSFHDGSIYVLDYV